MKTPTLAGGNNGVPRQLGSGWPRKVVFSPCDTGTLGEAREACQLLLLLLSRCGENGEGDRRRGSWASGNSLEPPCGKGRYCPLLAACDQAQSQARGWLEAVLWSQVPSFTCVQVQALPLPIYAAASRDLTSLPSFPGC